MLRNEFRKTDDTISQEVASERGIMNRRMKLSICPVIGMMIGAAFVAAGLCVFSMAQDATFYSTSYGGDVTHLGSKEYGADFYTDSYEATAFSGNALKNVFDLLSFSITAFFVLSGLLTICASLHVLLSSQAITAVDEEASDQTQKTDKPEHADVRPQNLPAEPAR